MKAAATTCIALLRGVNVGRAKRIAMADLRTVIEGLGMTGVRTLLNSGNVVFEAMRPDVDRIATAIASGIEAQFGFTVTVIVLTAQTLNAIVAENALHQAASDPSRFLVAFVSHPSAHAKAVPLLETAWGPEAMAVGSRAVYLWCANGILESPVAQAFSRATGDTATTRNWTTVLKLQSAAASLRDAA
jgi:uncharacterized protein (DUF1697 family)